MTTTYEFHFASWGSVWLLFWRQLREKCEDDSDTDHLFIFYTEHRRAEWKWCGQAFTGKHSLLLLGAYSLAATNVLVCMEMSERRNQWAATAMPPNKNPIFIEVGRDGPQRNFCNCKCHSTQGRFLLIDTFTLLPLPSSQRWAPNDSNAVA
jgi:hypothetical protein